MIYDMTAFLGPYDRRPVGGDAESLARVLGEWQVERAFAGRIDTLFLDNGNGAEQPQPPARFGAVTVETVPVIDPTLPTWADLVSAQFEANGRRLPMLRLHPGHHGYAIDDEKTVGPIVDWAHHHGVVIQVILSLDDSRRRHPAVKIQDVPLASLVRLAKTFPQQQFLASGALFGALAGLTKDRPDQLWADTARVEAAAGLSRLFSAGWGDRLVFGSFAPLLIMHSAIARILADLSDAQASQVFRKNAEAMLAHV